MSIIRGGPPGGAIHHAHIAAQPNPADLADEAFDLEVQTEVRQCPVGPELHGLRLDLALVALAPEFSRSYLQQLIEGGAVQVNDRAMGKPAAKVRLGDVVTVELRPTPQSQAFKAEAIDLDIVYKDADLLVVNKPAGLVVHPAPGNWSGTLLNALLAADSQAAGLPRAGIVHRLDKNTSGLMLVARTRAAMDELVRMIAAREVNRQYLAICGKSWTGRASVEIESAVGRDPRNRLRMAVVDLSHQSGKAAHTTVQLLSNSSEGCLLGCKLHTGRTHQIRVHLASMGYPLVADDVYGGPSKAGQTRQALHAHRLALAHPLTGKALQFEAPLPTDMQSTLVNLALDYN